MSHSRQTEHYELPLYDGNDIINPLTDFNNANSSIDEALYNANQRSVGAETTANEAKDIAEGYDTRVSQAIQTANDAMTLANNTQDMIADDFDPNKAGGYNVGDFVIYNGKLYRFINAHTGAWDASDVQVSPVLIEAIADVVDEGKQAINDAVDEAEQEIAGQTEKVTKTQAMIAQPFDANKSGGYAVDDVVTYADKLYKFTSAHSGAWTGLDVEQVDVEQQVTEMKQSFQNGVDTIYDAVVAEGVTPSASTPSAIASAVGSVYDKGKSDAESVTWTQTIASYTQLGGQNVDTNESEAIYDAKNLVELQCIKIDRTNYDVPVIVWLRSVGDRIGSPVNLTVNSKYTPPTGAVLFSISHYGTWSGSVSAVSGVELKATYQAKILR